MQWLKKHKLKLAISLLIACAFSWLLHAGGLPWLPAGGALEEFHWPSLFGYLAVWSIVHGIRAARWHWLLLPIARVPMKKLMAVSFVGFAAIVILPLRSGEMVRPALIREPGKLSGWSATGTVAAERIIDGLFLSVMLLVGLSASVPLSPLPDRIGHLEVSPEVVPVTAYTALVIFGLAFVAMGLFYFARARARQLVEWGIGWVSQPVAHWLAERVERVSDGLRFLPRVKYTSPFLLGTAVYWFLNAWATCLLADGAGLGSLDFAEACVLTGVLAIGIMVPNAPGFFGAFQLSAYAALSLFFTEADLLTRGSVLVFFLYAGQTAITFGGGALGAFWLHTSFSQALTTEDGALEGE